MKALLWIVLIGCLLANVYLNFLVDDGGTEIALSVVAGLGVVGSGLGLWLLRKSPS
ncbi:MULTISPECIES: hypothetical protein [Streptomyces]|uniref:hypothetical protein n=1 Tax=Streptomyces TaxID=1883 RepID=UPI00201F6BBC|nr:hypothetical protein [Streptomyces sp. 35G-GA-8]MCL7375775.1 hypothetical protein [Streptomyces sp. 35G-GA-8]